MTVKTEAVKTHIAPTTFFIVPATIHTEVEIAQIEDSISHTEDATVKIVIV